MGKWEKSVTIVRTLDQLFKVLSEECPNVMALWDACGMEWAPVDFYSVYIENGLMFHGDYIASIYGNPSVGPFGCIRLCKDGDRLWFRADGYPL